ncbi:MAG TPA: O-antigen ligase family protein, partial [Chloroflexota bacterium]|nr:O-antigen ligase family protein [Chloroflexota bacterium]
MARALWLIAVTLQGFALLLTQTRGAWVGAAAGLAVGSILFVRQRGGSWRRWSFAVALAGLVLVTGLWAGQDTLRRMGPLSRLGSIFDTREATIATRLVLWRTGFELWRDRPVLGYGPDTVASVLPRRLPSLPDQREVLGSDAVNEVYDRAHNATLDAFTAVGLVGWLTLAATASLILWHGWRLNTPPGVPAPDAPLDSESLRGHPLAAAAAAALVAYQVAQQFNIETAGPSSLAWILGGALAGSGALALQANHNHAARGAQRRQTLFAGVSAGSGVPTAVVGLTGLVAVLLLGLAVWSGARPLIASAAYKQGMELAKAKRAVEAVSAYERAVAWWPYEHRYWAELAYSRRFAARSLADSASRTAFKEAIDAVDRALEISPQNALLMSYLGDIAGEAASRWNDTALAERAIQSHARALQIAPDRWTYHSMAGLTHLRLNRAASARE